MPSKVCPRCLIVHHNKGKFCSRTCANSRTFSEESRLKKSVQNKKYYNAKTEEEKLIIKHQLNEIRVKNGVNCNSAASTAFLLEADTRNLKWQSIRKKVILEQQDRCLRCDINEWQGEKITLQVDHIDGNRYNNERSNLRALCPNCHSLTSTFCGRNRKQR